MKSEIADEILEELGSTFQKLETQCAALLEFVKDKGIAKEDDLAPYMERAAEASAVRWRGTQVRMARLLASAASGDGAKKEGGKAEEQRSKAKDEEHSQDKDKERIKQAESLAREPVEARSEDDAEKQKKGTSEKADQKDSKRQEPTKAEAGGRPSREQSGEAANEGSVNADQAADGKEGQAAATSSRKDKDSGIGEQKNDRRDVA
jgi:hypothetical protein